VCVTKRNIISVVGNIPEKRGGCINFSKIQAPSVFSSCVSVSSWWRSYLRVVSGAFKTEASRHIYCFQKLATAQTFSLAVSIVDL
jgi:hypothetical protein